MIENLGSMWLAYLAWGIFKRIKRNKRAYYGSNLNVHPGEFEQGNSSEQRLLTAMSFQREHHSCLLGLSCSAHCSCLIPAGSYLNFNHCVCLKAADGLSGMGTLEGHLWSLYPLLLPLFIRQIISNSHSQHLGKVGNDSFTWATDETC